MLIFSELPQVWQEAYDAVLSEVDRRSLTVKLAQNSGAYHEFIKKFTTLPFDKQERNKDLKIVPTSKVRKLLIFSSDLYGTSFNLRWKSFKCPFSGCFHHGDAPIFKPKFNLSFPHSALSFDTERYMNKQTKPVSKDFKEKNSRAQWVYDQVMDVSTSHNSFLDILRKHITNDDVMVGLIEHRLGWRLGYLSDEIWSFYFGFAKQKAKNPLLLLNVYRKYTRLFIENTKMVDEYRGEIERIGQNHPVCEYWIDTILWELDFGSSEKAHNLIHYAFTIVTNTPLCHEISTLNDDTVEKIMEIMVQTENLKFPIKFVAEINDDNFENEDDIEFQGPITCYYPKAAIPLLKKTQQFSFPRHLIHHICSRASYETLQTLFYTCKYFFATRPLHLCYNLNITEKGPTKYIGQSLQLNEKDVNCPILDNLIVTEILNCCSYQRYVLSKVLSKLSSCQVQRGNICCQILYFQEYRSIVPEGNIKYHPKLYLYFLACRIFDYNGEIVN